MPAFSEVKNTRPACKNRYKWSTFSDSAELRSAVSGETRFDSGMRAAYAADASNYRQVPIGVVLPRSVSDVVEAMRICAAHGVPVLPRGGATSLNGQCVNVAVVIDCSKYLDRVLSSTPRRGSRTWSPARSATRCATRPSCTASPSRRIRPRILAARSAA